MATGRIGVTPVLRTRWSDQPTAGTTSLSGLDDNSVALVYDAGYEAVYRNGVLLSRGNDYTATDGTSITLIDATLAGDIIEVFANDLVPLTDAISKGQYNAKGALLSASAASTPGVLAVGSNNQVLTADSAETTGLKWATPSSTFVGVSLSKNASQSIANGATTALTFQVELFDTDGFHSTVTNTERITIPAGKGGYYLIVGQVSMTGTATLTNVRRVPDIRKNGSSTLKNVDAPIGQDYPNATVMAIANLVATDYIELRVYNGQGSSLPINDGAEATQFAAYYLGA